MYTKDIEDINNIIARLEQRLTNAEPLDLTSREIRALLDYLYTLEEVTHTLTLKYPPNSRHPR